MKRFGKAALTAMMLMGAAFFTAAPAKADVAIGFSFGNDGGYFSDPCDYYDYYSEPPPWGMPPDYCDYPVYFEPVYYSGYWYRGPIYYRWYGGQRLFWINGGWRRDDWRGPRPSIRWTDRGGWNRGRDWGRDRGDWGRRDWGDRGRDDHRDWGDRNRWNNDHRGDWNRGDWNRGDHRDFRSGNNAPPPGGDHNWNGPRTDRNNLSGGGNWNAPRNGGDRSGNWNGPRGGDRGGNGPRGGWNGDRGGPRGGDHDGGGHHDGGGRR